MSVRSPITAARTVLAPFRARLNSKVGALVVGLLLGGLVAAGGANAGRIIDRTPFVTMSEVGQGLANHLEGDLQNDDTVGASTDGQAAIGDVARNTGCHVLLNIDYVRNDAEGRDYLASELAFYQMVSRGSDITLASVTFVASGGPVDGALVLVIVGLDCSAPPAS